MDVMDNKMLYCTASINEKFHILLADDNYYNFLGNFVGRNFILLIEEEEEKAFRTKVLATLPGYKDRMIVHIHIEEKLYLIDIQIANNGRYIGGQRVWDLDFFDITNVEKKFLYYADLMRKYRMLLAISSEYLFDYEPETDIVSIYRYMELNSVLYFKGTIGELRNEILKRYKDASQAGLALELCDKVAEHQVEFTTDLFSPSLDEKDQFTTYRVTGRVVTKLDGSRFMAGMLREIRNKEADEMPLYMLPDGRDNFTGLLNKRGTEEYVKERLKNGKKKHYLVEIDIDNFKNINDTYGHLFGDQVILGAAQIMKKRVGDRGIVGHFGGDEFLIFTEGIETELELRALLTAIRQETTATFDAQKDNCHITYSMGASLFPDNGDSYKRLFWIADQCLYLAKKKGRNRYIIYVPEKHGTLDQDAATVGDGFAVGRKMDHQAERVGDLIVNLSRKGKEGIPECLEQIRTLVSIEGIRICSSASEEPIYVSGDYKKIPDMMPFIRDGRMKSFLHESHSWLSLGNVSFFAAEDKEFYDVLTDANVKGLYCSYNTTPAGDDIFIYFDVFGRTNCWTEEDKSDFLIISRMIASYL